MFYGWKSPKNFNNMEVLFHTVHAAFSTNIFILLICLFFFFAWFFLRLLPSLASLYWASQHFQDEVVSLMPNPQPGGPGFYFRVCCPSDVGKLTTSSRTSPPRHFGSSSGTCHAWVTLPIACYRRQGPSFSEAGYTHRQVCVHVYRTKNVLNEPTQWVLLEKIIFRQLKKKTSRHL